MRTRRARPDRRDDPLRPGPFALMAALRVGLAHDRQLLIVTVEAVVEFLIGLGHLSTCNDAPDPGGARRCGKAAVLRPMLVCVIP